MTKAIKGLVVELKLRIIELELLRKNNVETMANKIEKNVLNSVIFEIERILEDHS